jgi:hypothetical protein
MTFVAEVRPYNLAMVIDSCTCELPDSIVIPHSRSYRSRGSSYVFCLRSKHRSRAIAYSGTVSIGFNQHTQTMCVIGAVTTLVDKPADVNVHWQATKAAT